MTEVMERKQGRDDGAQLWLMDAVTARLNEHVGK